MEGGREGGRERDKQTDRQRERVGPEQRPPAGHGVRVPLRVRGASPAYSPHVPSTAPFRPPSSQAGSGVRALFACAARPLAHPCHVPVTSLSRPCHVPVTSR